MLNVHPEYKLVVENHFKGTHTCEKFFAKMSPEIFSRTIK